MSVSFVGWDVGAWNCDKGKSRDALCVLYGTSLDSLTVAAPPWRGNLRQHLTTCSRPESLLVKTGLPTPASKVVVAIDTPLGWPVPFRRLLENGILETVPEQADKNPYLFRKCELQLFSRGFRPLSTVRDLIGSQSSKGLYYLHKAGYQQTEPAVWCRDSWTAIETYPSPVRTSPLLQEHHARLRQLQPFVLKTGVGKNAEADLLDSLWCALVAALYEFAPERLTGPSAEESAHREEGWIWLPDDCAAAEADEEIEDDD